MRARVALLAVGASLATVTPVAHAARPLTSSVETRMGTDEGAADFGTGGGAGATCPGAGAPIGKQQQTPDTEPP
jgi:putative alpha-1,2-mannosidase